MEGVIDTNVVISSLIREDVNHKEARKILESLEAWIIPSIVFHEFVWFLKQNNLNTLLILPFLEHPKCFLVETLKEDIKFAVNKSKKNPKNYNDSILLSIALRTSKKLITFDEELQREFTKELTE